MKKVMLNEIVESDKTDVSIKSDHNCCGYLAAFPSKALFRAKFEVWQYLGNGTPSSSSLALPESADPTSE
jgi:hypothetical protein